MAYKHADTLALKPVQPKKRKRKSEAPILAAEPIIETNPVAESAGELVVVVPVVESLAAPASVTAESIVTNSGAHKHLKTALAELIERQSQIDEELARMQALQVEKEVVSKQINAVHSALQAFGE